MDSTRCSTTGRQVIPGSFALKKSSWRYTALPKEVQWGKSRCYTIGNSVTFSAILPP